MTFNIQNIINWLKKNISKRDVVILCLLFFGFLLTRLINLDKFPIFTDEGIYIHWAKVAWHDATWRFISLTDGRQPLQTWGTIPFLKLFESNALFAGRLFAVSSGFITLSGLMTCVWYLFGKRASYISGILYVITPYFMFYDRMALVDSTVNAGVIWMFFLSILLAQKRSIDIAIIFGAVSGLTLLAKSSVKLFVGMSFLSILFIILESENAIHTAFKKLFSKLQLKITILNVINYSILFILAGGISYTLYNIQRLSPFFHFVNEKNHTFVLSFTELLQNPFQLLFSNILRIPYYIFAEMGYIIPSIGIVGLFLLLKKKKVEGIYLGLWLLLSTICIAAVARVLYPRYIMSLGLLLLIPASYTLTVLLHKRFQVISWGLLILSVLYFNYTILFSPANIPFPQIDRGQYIEGWPAGGGIREIVDYARIEAQTKPVYILAEGNFGMSGDVLDSMLKPTDTNIVLSAHWPLDLTVLQETQKELKEKTVLIVFSHRAYFNDAWPIRFIKKYNKPKGKSVIYLYELTQ